MTLNPNWSKQMRYEGVWSPRAAVDAGRKRGQKKLQSANKSRALAMRYQQDASRKAGKI